MIKYSPSKEAIEYNITRLTKQVWKMIPMRENNELWENSQKQLSQKYLV